MIYSNFSTVPDEQEDSQKTTVNDLPPELISHIQSFLPSYQFRGQNAVGNVAVRWHKAQSKYEAKGVKKDKQAIVDSCKTPEDALFILQDKARFQCFSFDQQLQIIANHPDIVTFVLREAKNILMKNQIALLCSKHLSLADSVLSATELHKHMSQNDWLTLGKSNPDIALRIIKTPTLSSGYLLCNFAEKYRSVAEYIATNEKLRTLFYQSAVNLYLPMNRAVREAISNDQKLQAEITASDISSPSSIKKLFAQKILNTPEIRNELNSVDLSYMGQHPEIAQHILTADDLKSRLDGNLLGELGAAHPSTAEYILKTPFLRAMLEPKNLLLIASTKNLNIAMLMLDIPEVAKKLDSDCLAWFGIHNDLAQRILNTPDLRNKLTERHLARINDVITAPKFPLTLSDLLKVSNDALRNYGRNYYAAAKLILDNPELIKKSYEFIQHAENIVRVNNIIDQAHLAVSINLEKDRNKSSRCS